MFSYCQYEFCWLCGGWYGGSLHFAPFNPFGCPGLQNSDETAKNWNCLKRMCYRLMVFLLILLALPFVIVFAIPILFTSNVDDCLNMDDWNCCCRCLTWIPLFMLGMVLNCLAIPLAAAALPFAILIWCGFYCHARYEAYQNVQERERRNQAHV